MATQLTKNLEQIQWDIDQYDQWAKAIKNHKSFEYTEKPKYTALEYIQTTGTQYINTGVYAGSTPIGFEIDFQLTDVNGAYFGHRSGAGSARFGCINYNSKFHMMIGDSDIWNYSVNTSRHRGSVKILSNYSYSWTFDNYSGTGTTNSSVLCNKPFLIGQNDHDGWGKMKIYSCKLYNSSGTLIRDLVPAKDLDGIVCMYDKLNDVFYYNAGTGSFTAGGVI